VPSTAAPRAPDGGGRFKASVLQDPAFKLDAPDAAAAPEYLPAPAPTGGRARAVLSIANAGAPPVPTRATVFELVAAVRPVTSADAGAPSLAVATPASALEHTLGTGRRRRRGSDGGGGEPAWRLPDDGDDGGDDDGQEGYVGAAAGGSSLPYRIDALRSSLAAHLGDEGFLVAYRAVAAAADAQGRGAVQRAVAAAVAALAPAAGASARVAFEELLRLEAAAFAATAAPGRGRR